jgi:hypothetical protein
LHPHHFKKELPLKKIGELHHLRVPITIESKRRIIRICGILDESSETYKGEVLIFFKHALKGPVIRFSDALFMTKQDFLSNFNNEGFIFSKFEHGQ